MKKLIALLLVVVLAASAFCLEAFAVNFPSDFDEGTVNGKHWIARLTSNEETASSKLNWNGYGSVRVNMRGNYFDGWDQYKSFYSSSTGNGTPATYTVANPLIQYIWEVSSTCKIQGRVVSTLSTHY